MTTTTICQLLDFDELTLIESADSPISGVGESTIQQIREWVDLIGIDEEEMIRKTTDLSSTVLSLQFPSKTPEVFIIHLEM